jgi:hypothetical protein
VAKINALRHSTRYKAELAKGARILSYMSKGIGVMNEAGSDTSFLQEWLDPISFWVLQGNEPLAKGSGR